MPTREAEMVDGTWMAYFKKVSKPVFNDEIFAHYDALFAKLYGDFFQRNLFFDGGPLLSLGAGYGRSEIPLAKMGFSVIGADNDTEALKHLRANAAQYAEGRLEAMELDLYDLGPADFANRGVQACVSFGVLEHFTPDDLQMLIKKQFQISPILIAMMPINTPNTLKTFEAEKNPVGNVDKNGIYRNFWTADYWENVVFGKYDIVDRCFPSETTSRGINDMATYLVREKGKA